MRRSSQLGGETILNATLQAPFTGVPFVRFVFLGVVNKKLPGNST